MPVESYLWQGADAIANAAIVAECNFFAGYPITPSTEVAEKMSYMLPINGGVYIQMEDEIASICALIGSSLAGGKAMTATSGPGFSLMQEGLGYAQMVEAPLVIVDVMRGGPSTGLPTKTTQADIYQARWGTHGDHPSIVVCPSSVKETYYLTIKAFNLAERFRTPVIFLTDETICHMRERVDIDVSQCVPIVKRIEPTDPTNYKTYASDDKLIPHQAKYGSGFRTVVTALYHDESGFQNTAADIANRFNKRIIDKVENYIDEFYEIDEHNLANAETVFFSYGCSHRTVLQVINDAKNPKWGYLRVVTLWPFHDKLVRQKLEKAKNIIVPELNMGMMVREIQRLFGPTKNIIPVNRWDGELITPEQLRKVAEGI